MARPVIALLTDFGTRDHYTGTMKAVALSICPEAILVDTYVPETTIPEAKVEQPVVEPPPSIPTEGIPLPPGILPTYILPVNQSFAYTIPEDDDRKFFSFRWVEAPPRGMYFHYDTRSIEWVPDQSQLGAYELEFLLKMKVGENVEDQETAHV
mgnify:CR=1 FL=1